MPRFLGLDGAFAIHHEQIDAFGGTHGVRDQELPESAIGEARSTYADANDVFEAAAQYCVSIAKNHPFLDGNKRAAAACMLTFLVMNRIEPTLASAQLFDWTMQAAIGKLDREELASLLRDNSKPIGRRKK